MTLGSQNWVAKRITDPLEAGEAEMTELAADVLSAGAAGAGGVHAQRAAGSVQSEPGMRGGAGLGLAGLQVDAKEGRGCRWSMWGGRRVGTGRVVREEERGK